MNPVIQAFLAGQAGQQQNIEQARDWGLKKQQLDQVAKEMQTRADQFQQDFELRNRVAEQTHQMHMSDLQNQYMQMMHQGIIPVQGTTTTQNQTPTGPPVPGIGQIPEVPYSQTTLPPVGTPQSFNTPEGNISFPRPQTQLEAATEQAKSLGPIQSAQRIAEYQATEGNTDKLKFENALNIALNKIEGLKTGYEMRLQGVQEANATRSAIAEANLYKSMLMMGITPGMMGDQSGTIANLKNSFKLGEASPDKSNPLHKAALNQLTLDGGVPLAPKQKSDITESGVGVARLLNDFQQLDSQYPASGSPLGRTGNRLAGFFDNTTDIGQKFKEFQSNIAAYAKLTGETPSMARSVALAKKAEGAAPNPGDNPDIRKDKFFRIVDLGLDKIQAGLSNLPQTGRVDNWKDLLQNNPFLLNLKRDPRFKQTLENIVRTGNYNPIDLNAAKK